MPWSCRAVTCHSMTGRPARQTAALLRRYPGASRVIGRARTPRPPASAIATTSFTPYPPPFQWPASRATQRDHRQVVGAFGRADVRADLAFHPVEQVVGSA